MLEPFTTATAVAKATGLSREKIRQLTDDGTIPFHVVPGETRRRYRLGEVEQVFGECQGEPADPFEYAEQRALARRRAKGM